MATDVTLGGDGKLFVGEDKVFELELLDKKPDDTSAAPVNMAGWTVLFDVRVKDSSSDPSLLSMNATVTGTFNAIRSMNAQRAVITLTDTQMNLFKARTYRYSFKRMDDGSETVLSRGDFAPEKATAP